MKKFNQVYRRIMESVSDIDNGESISSLKEYLKEYGKNLKYDKHVIKYIDTSSHEGDFSKIIAFSKNPLDLSDKSRAAALHHGVEEPGDMVIWKIKDGSYELGVYDPDFPDSYSAVIVYFDNKDDIVDFFKKHGASHLVSHF